MRELNKSNSEQEYVHYIIHHIGNSVMEKNSNRFEQTRDHFFDTLSQDTKISPLSQIAFASTLGTFYQSEEVKNWLRNPTKKGKEYTTLSGHYKGKILPKLQEISSRAHRGK